MDFKDYYKTLGVSSDAEATEIKRAFRKLARKYHPDTSSEPGAEAMFKDVSEAFEVLGDPEKRRAYDQLGQGDTGQAGGFRPPPGWDSGFEFSGGGPAGNEEFSDFFEQMFRRGQDPMGATQGAHGADQHARIELDIEDAYRGATRVLSLRVPQVGPGGQVQWRDRSISVHVPKGIVEGQHIRLSGQGQAAPGRGRAGDLFLQVAFAPHPIYRADGRDLYLDLPVSPWEAALGAKIVMPTPDGKVDLRIPENARTGQTLRLRGKGLPGTPPGDILASLRIVNPKVTTDAARTLFEEMARTIPFDPRADIGG